MVYELQDLVAYTMRKALALIRALGIALVYAVTLGCIFAARQFWLEQTPSLKTGPSRFQIAAEAVLRTSPYIILTAMLFAFLAAPLAAWSVSSASWSSLKRYIYVFWLVLAIFIVASGNAGGLILISGAGLITLWFVTNRRSLNSNQVNLKSNARVQRPFEMLCISSDVAAFAVLAAVVCVLSLYLCLRNGTKVYVSEIFAIYVVACVCQGLKAFQVIGPGRNANREEPR